MSPGEVLQLAASLVESGEGFVLCTVVEAASSTPGRPGFKMLVRENGESSGTVGGGNVERTAFAEAMKLMGTGGTRLFRYTLTEEIDGLGMACGGDIVIYMEHIAPARRAFLFGAGHMGRALTPILRSVGFHVVVIDDRPGMATPERISQGCAFHTADYADFVRGFFPTPQDSVVIFTHGHGADHTILSILCERRLDCAYIGMIGSKRKVGATMQMIREAQPEANEWLAKVFAPIGLNVARRNAPEIAIAIAAEMLAVYNGVSEPRSMR